MQANKNKMLSADAVPQMSRWGSRTTVTRRMSSMTINVAEATTTTKVRSPTPTPSRTTLAYNPI